MTISLNLSTIMKPPGSVVSAASYKQKTGASKAARWVWKHRASLDSGNAPAERKTIKSRSQLDLLRHLPAAA